MLIKFKSFKIFTHFEVRRTLSICNLASNKGFCNKTESPELPDWVKFPQDSNLVLPESEDDFVLPVFEKWVSNQKVQTGFLTVRNAPNEILDSDVDKISKILKGTFVSYDEVIKALGHCNVDVSKSLLDKVLRRFSNDSISAFGFFKWAEKKMGCKHVADSYDIMVDILGRTKQFDIMWELVEEMVQLGGLFSLTTMTKILRRLAGSGRWTEAIRTFREIENFGLSKDTSAMNLLLDTLCKERSVEHADEAFLEFKNEIAPDSHTFNILIHGWCKARKLDNARSTMVEMEKHGFCPSVVSYTNFVEAYCREKDFRKVDAVLDEMQAKGCPPNTVTYTIVMHSLGKAKEVKEALDIYERMKNNGCVPDTSFYNSLIYIFSKSGRLHDARNIYEEMSKSGNKPDITTYNTMISSACEHSEEENALKLLFQMEENLCIPDLKTYAPLLKMCCRKKMTRVLFYLLNDMFKKDVSLELGTYTLLVQGLCKNGKVEHACLFFEEMVLKGFCPRSSTYDMLVKEFERKNMEDAKQKIHSLMVQARSGNQSAKCSSNHVNLQSEFVDDE